MLWDSNCCLVVVLSVYQQRVKTTCLWCKTGPVCLPQYFLFKVQCHYKSATICLFVSGHNFLTLFYKFSLHGNWGTATAGPGCPETNSGWRPLPASSVRQGHSGSQERIWSLPVWATDDHGKKIQPSYCSVPKSSRTHGIFVKNVLQKQNRKWSFCQGSLSPDELSQGKHCFL